MNDAAGTPRDRRCILSIDLGSSSLKIAAYEMGDASEQRLVEGGVDKLTSPNAVLSIRDDRASPRREMRKPLGGASPIAAVLDALHAVAQRLPLPRQLWTEGVRRYGFHGLSYESIVRELGVDGTRGRMIVAHLGNGASLAAIRDGRSVDTTMGFTALGGLMMGTRPGDLDPGVLLYLLRERNYTLGDLNELVTERSGLLGVSQISADMQTLLEQRAGNPAASEAVDLFVYQTKKYIGALVAVLGGLDTLVFTGGIGERAAPVRWEIAQGLAHLGVELDPMRNAAGAAIVSADDTGVLVRVIEAQENLMVARHTYATLFDSSAKT